MKIVAIALAFLLASILLLVAIQYEFKVVDVRHSDPDASISGMSIRVMRFNRLTGEACYARWGVVHLNPPGSWDVGGWDCVGGGQ